MLKVDSTEVSHNFDYYREQAELEAITILHGNKPAIVMLAADEYERLKRRDKKVLSIVEIPEWLADLVNDDSAGED